jgi:4-hydroxy-3-polyprenylbenzoate decarboxylase
MYRTMVHNRKTLSTLLHPGQDQGIIFFKKYQPFKKPMPFLVALGADPISCMASAGQFAPGISEVNFAGALAQKPIELVKAETSDLLAPAHAEVIIEGDIMPDVMVPEGPFGEFTGFRTPQESRYTYRVRCITHRKDPIIGMSVPGMPVDESHILPALGGNIEV